MNKIKPRHDIYVLVTTKHRGVFGGTLESQNGNSVVLTNARCAIYCNTTGGFIELADVGPNAKTRLGNVVPRIELFDVTSITDCTDVAAAKWEAHVNTEKDRRVMNPPAADYGNLHADEKSEVPANWVLAEPGAEIIDRPVLVLTRETEDSYGHWWRSKKTSLDVDPELYKAVYVPPAKPTGERSNNKKGIK